MKENDNHRKEQIAIIHTLAEELVDRDKKVMIPTDKCDVYLQIVYQGSKKEYNLILTTTFNQAEQKRYLPLAHFNADSLHASRLYSLESALTKLAQEYDLTKAQVVLMD